MREHTLKRAVLLTATGIVALVFSGLASGCSCTPKLEPPAQAVQSLLELRSTNSTDTKRYERYIESTALASALAEDSAEATTSRVPKWDPPKVKLSSDTTATVEVSWKVPALGFDGWPETTDFMLAFKQGLWKIVDAEGEGSDEASSSAPATSSP